ncbi:MAG: permease [Sulfurovum sp.]|nr:permease [Sulfurovum sp.]
MNHTQLKKRKSSGKIMLLVVVVLYTITFFLSPKTGQKALASAWEIIEMVAPILLIVFFLMALLNTSIDSKYIAKHLGKESGLKGWLIALGGGILSHGPAYVWYPMLAQMREHGAREGLIVAFFYARSVKLPWLPLMVSYFGLLFTVLLTFFVIVGAWLQGLVADMLLKEKEKDDL